MTSLEELVNAWRQVISDDGMSAKEIAAATGLNRNTINQRIAEAVRLGLMRFVGYKTQKRVDGALAKIPLYQVVVTRKSRGKCR